MATLDELMDQVRARMGELLSGGQPTRDTALLLADLEEEQDRRARADEKLTQRVTGLAGDANRVSSFAALPGAAVLGRPLPAGLDDRAGVPRSHREPTEAERERGVVVAYSNAHPTFYRAVIDRLRDEEKFRIETQHGNFEMTRAEFETALPAMARSNSYQRGTDTAPGAARYVTGRVPQTIERFRVA